MFHAAIEVEFGPHWADEWLVWATVASVAVSVIVAWLAYRNGLRASNIAMSSEAARKSELDESRRERERESALRREFELRLRVDDAISEFFLSINSYIAAYEAWLDDADSAETRLPPSADPDLLVLAPRPSGREALATLENLLLRAKPGDVSTFAELRSLVNALLHSQSRDHPSYLLSVVTATRQFRTGAFSHTQFGTVMYKLRREATEEGVI